jgi:hypothetical protein
MAFGCWGHAALGDEMFRSTQWFALALLALATVSLAAASAWAFSQQNLGGGGDGNSTFADPDERVNNFGKGTHLFGPNGPTVQFGAQQGQPTPFNRFQSNGYNSTPPDPYSRPPGNGN